MGSVSVSERVERQSRIAYPVFIICPEQGFQPSYFKAFDYDVYPGISSYLWKFPLYRHIVLSNKTIPEAHDNMSLQLGIHWTITLVKNPNTM